MKRKLLSLFLVILITVGILFDVIPAFATTGSTVGTSTTNQGTTRPMQQKLFFANSRYWVFYSNGTNIGFKTSSDNGSTWSAFTSVGAGSSGVLFSVYFDSTNISYAREVGAKLYFREGTPNATGNITWAAAEKEVVSANATNFNISEDSSGHNYIIYGTSNGGKYATITKNNSTNGTWSTAIGYPTIVDSTTANCSYIQLLSLTSNKLYAVYSSTTNNTIYGKLFDGTWGLREKISSFPAQSGIFSATSNNDTIDVLYLRLTTSQIRDVNRNSGTGLWIETVTSLPVASNSYTSVSSYGDDLVVYSINSTTKHIFYQKRISGVWQTPVDWLDESADGFSSPSYAGLIASIKTYNNYSIILYTTKTASPYDVKFARLDMLTIAPTCSSLYPISIAMNKDGVTSGNFSGNVTATGSDATFKYWWQYGLTASYGSYTANSTGNTTGVKTLSIPSNLTPGQTYHYRFVGQNTVGTSYGSDKSFTFTLPTNSTVSSTNVFMDTSTHATLNGLVSSMGSASSSYVYFQWGYNTSYGNVSSNVTVLSTGTVSIPIQHFIPLQTVHYRCVIQNGSMKNYGADRTFMLTGGSDGASSNGITTSYQLLQVALITFVGAGLFLMMRAFEDGNYIVGILLAGVIAYLIVSLLTGMNGAINNLL